MQISIAHLINLLYHNYLILKVTSRMIYGGTNSVCSTVQRFAMREFIKIFTLSAIFSLVHFVLLCLKAMGKPRCAALYVHSRITCTASVSLPSYSPLSNINLCDTRYANKFEVELMIHDVGINNIERASSALVLVSLETA